MDICKEGITVIHIGHLGIVAAIIGKLGLIERIDERIPVSKSPGSMVTMGKRVTAMILNGVGFLNDKLYLHPKIFEDKLLSHLFY